MVNLLPFLLLGLGIDDSFVIVDILKKTPAPLTMTDAEDIVMSRVPRTMARAGASILVTTLTDMVAFFVGVFRGRVLAGAVSFGTDAVPLACLTCTTAKLPLPPLPPQPTDDLCTDTISSDAMPL